MAVWARVAILGAICILLMLQSIRGHRQATSWSITPLVVLSNGTYTVTAEENPSHAVGYLHIHVSKSSLTIPGIWLWGYQLSLQLDAFVPDPEAINTVAAESIAEAARQGGVPATESDHVGQMIDARYTSATFVSWPGAIANVIALGLILWMLISLITIAIQRWLLGPPD